MEKQFHESLDLEGALNRHQRESLVEASQLAELFMNGFDPAKQLYLLQKHVNRAEKYLTHPFLRGFDLRALSYIEHANKQVPDRLQDDKRYPGFLVRHTGKFVCERA